MSPQQPIKNLISGDEIKLINLKSKMLKLVRHKRFPKAPFSTRTRPYKKIDPSSLSWIINYRSIPKSKTLKDVMDEDGHSGGSFFWTKKQSEKIDQIGWDEWFTKTEGPRGYSYFLDKWWGV